MENKPALTFKSLFSQENVQAKFKELLGQKAQGFITSVLQITSSNALLAKADPYSIYNSACVAATLDLPLNNNLGFAYIVPYNQKQPDGTYKQVAQFQLGYKGFIQLAQRSGQFKTISATPIYEGQLIESNPLTGFKFDFTVKSEKVIGYAAFFQLLNGFEKTLYMTVEDLKKHGVKYSQTFKKNFGLWATDFDSMAVKTVIKLLLSKFAPLSIEMQKAVTTDQATINNEDGTDVSYDDHEEVVIDKESERVALMIGDAKTPEELELIKEHVGPEQSELFNEKKKKINGSK
jgi:recombination protein RecT